MIELMHIDLIVPRDVIEKKYLGGWRGCIQDHLDLLGGSVWYDGFLFSERATDYFSMVTLVEKWRKLGFEPYDEEDGKPTRWRELCVIDEHRFGLTLPCDWIQVERRYAYLKGRDSKEGLLIGPGFFQIFISQFNEGRSIFLSDQFLNLHR
jgi:hypothetical protein